MKAGMIGRTSVQAVLFFNYTPSFLNKFSILI